MNLFTKPRKFWSQTLPKVTNNLVSHSKTGNKRKANKLEKLSALRKKNLLLCVLASTQRTKLRTTLTTRAQNQAKLKNTTSKPIRWRAYANLTRTLCNSEEFPVFSTWKPTCPVSLAECHPKNAITILNPSLPQPTNSVTSCNHSANSLLPPLRTDFKVDNLWRSNQSDSYQFQKNELLDK